ncbi:MAG: type IV secretion system protein [Azoarcus sp.]|jgi:type IV secretion system protein VirB6|nr:type IV secretion system protein [Azoarcus sp.]
MSFSFDTAKPVASLISIVDTEIANTAISASHGIATVIMPLVAICFGIYIILVVVDMMRGNSSNPVWDVWMRWVAFSIVIGLGLNINNYQNLVIPMIQSLGNDLSSAISGSPSPAAGLDDLVAHYMKIIDTDYDRIQGLGFWDGSDNVTQPLLWFFKSLVIYIGLIPFLVAAGVLLIIAKVGTMLVAAVGPIFFACLMFPATRQYFSSWMNSVVSYALLPVLVAIVGLFGIEISKTIFGFNGTTFEDMSFTTCVKASLVNWLLIFLLLTCKALASSLSAGGINPGTVGGGGVASRAGRGAAKLAGKGAAGAAAAGKWTGGKALGGAGRLGSAVMNLLKGSNGVKPG